MEDCSHPPCTCQHERDVMVEDGGSLYCSQTCVEQDLSAESCECGHPQCEG